MIDFTFDAQQAIGKYIYALRDPRDGQIFYVGKGTGDRIIQHKKAAEDESKAVLSAKLSTINEIEKAGHQVDHLILRHGLKTDSEALLAEQAVIDAFAATGHQLTNLVKGHHSEEFGLKSLETFLSSFKNELTPAIDAPVLMFKIQNKWKPEMTLPQIYEATRGHWKIGKQTRLESRYALGIAHGVVRAVFSIDEWQPSVGKGLEGRWHFTGKSSTDLDKLVGTTIKGVFKKGTQTPFLKFPKGYKPPTE
jgi:hypothetical protein